MNRQVTWYHHWRHKP